MKIFNKGGFNSSTPFKLLHSLKIFNKGLILPSGLNFYIYSLKIFIDDDDEGGGDDDDDVVERTRTGPSAVRSDLEHQVTVTMMLKQSIFYHVFSSYEEGGPTVAGKTRCLAVQILYMVNLGGVACRKLLDLYIYI